MRSTRAAGSSCCSDSSMRCVPRPTPCSALLPQVGQARGTARAPAAVMAAQGAVGLVEHGKGRAVRTVRQPAACFAGDDRRIAATVEEHQRLLALLQCRLAARAGSAARCPRRPVTAPGSTSSMAGAIHVSVDGPLTQRQQPVAPGARMGPAFDRRRGGPEDDRDAQHLRTLHGQVARRVAHAFAGLVRRVVLLVDDDQRKSRQRREDREPRADDDARATFVGGQPRRRTLAGREPAVQRHHAERRKAGTHLGLELWRQVDLRHQQQRLRTWDPPRADVRSADR